MAVKKATWLGSGTLRALAIPRGRTKSVQGALLTGAVMRLHGAYLVVQDARTGLIEYQGSAVSDVEARRIKGVRGYAPNATRPAAPARPAVPKPKPRPKPVAVAPVEPPKAPEVEEQPVEASAGRQACGCPAGDVHRHDCPVVGFTSTKPEPKVDEQPADTDEGLEGGDQLDEPEAAAEGHGFTAEDLEELYSRPDLITLAKANGLKVRGSKKVLAGKLAALDTLVCPDELRPQIEEVSVDDDEIIDPLEDL